MLVLTRKIGEKILIGDDIVISVLDVRGDSIRIGVDAPRGLKIQRDEVVRAVLESNIAASQIDPAAEERIKDSLKMLAALQSARVQSKPAAPHERPTTPTPHPPRLR